LFYSRFEAFAAYGIHRKEGECLCEWYTIRSGMQKFDVRNHFPEDRAQCHFTESSLGNRPFHQQSRPPCQREALNDANEPLVFDREDGFLLVWNTDPRRSVFAGLVDLTRHYKQDYKPAMKQSMLPKCSDKSACPATFSIYENSHLTHRVQIRFIL
jgi:hypothetical protein